jgi:hypothetical protein
MQSSVRRSPSVSISSSTSFKASLCFLRKPVSSCWLSSASVCCLIQSLMLSISTPFVSFSFSSSACRRSFSSLALF